MKRTSNVYRTWRRNWKKTKKTKKTKKMAVVVMSKARAQAAREQFTCRVCNKSLQQRKHLNEHIKRAHGPKVRCAMCNEPFTNHGNEAFFVCCFSCHGGARQTTLEISTTRSENETRLTDSRNTPIPR